MPAKKSLVLTLPEDHYALTSADKEQARQEHSLGLIVPADPLLMRKAAVIEPNAIDTQHVKEIIERLYEAAYGQRRNRPKGKKRRTLVGLAAPQIGELVRIILIDTQVDPSRKKYGKLECFINPEVVWRTRETGEGREGCFSAGPVWGLVRRPVAIKMRAYMPDGTQVERVLEGFAARIAAHEIDHLDGIRFADRIRTDRKRHWVHAEEVENYPKHIKHWPRLCTRERWEQLKHGVSGLQ